MTGLEVVQIFVVVERLEDLSAIAVEREQQRLPSERQLVQDSRTVNARMHRAKKHLPLSQALISQELIDYDEASQAELHAWCYSASSFEVKIYSLRSSRMQHIQIN